jgi:DnaJ-class molecular chaperone
VTEDETCTACNGAGWVSSPTICSVCHGSGTSDSWATRLPPPARERIDMTPCIHCRATGYATRSAEAQTHTMGAKWLPVHHAGRNALVTRAP